jgi:hypothetical protein
MTPHLSFDTTNERIAELQAVAAAAHRQPDDVQPVDQAAPGPIDRLRDAIGHRLIDLGSAVASDQPRPRRLARP